MHGNANTPYGPVVQRVKLTDTYTLDYVHPCAYFYYLSMICENFCKFINDTLDTIGTRPLRIVVYGDEMTPGNPLRPDQGREAWQWSFSILEFPNHVLHSHAGWIHLTTLRTSVLHDLAGGVPMLAKSILHMLFFGTHNFRDGFYVKHPGGGMRPIKAIFFGFMADEKGLKEFYCLKGAGGFKCCPHCLNVTNRVKMPDDSQAVGIDCHTRDRFDRCTDKLFYGMLAKLQDMRNNNQLGELLKTEVDYGVKYDPHSMFVDPRLKPMLSPMRNYIRDPQHTLFSGGVAESEVAGVVLELKRHGISIDDFERYSVGFVMPKRASPVDNNWFKTSMYSQFGTKHFAGDMITIVRLMAAFLQDMVAPGLMDRHIECFLLLDQITSIIMSSGDATASIIAALRVAIDRHASIFTELYHLPKYYKVKWHHLLHLPDDLRRLGKLLSCFPMERKHKDIKVQMVNSFRSVERTTVYSYLNATITAMITGQTQFRSEYLLDPVDGRSTKAVLPIGMVVKDDMVVFSLDTRAKQALGKVVQFVQEGSTLCAHLLQFKPCSRDCWDTSKHNETIVDSRKIICPVPYKFAAKNTIRIIAPAIA